jgi:hypothetical protein
VTAAERNLALQWVVAVVAGWAIGFFLCEAIEQFVSTFFVDGLVIGSAMGIAQAVVLRRRIAPFFPWVLVSIVGFGVGKFVADLIGQTVSDVAGMAIAGAVIGLLVGLTQAVILMDRYANAWRWIAANVVAWSVGWTVIDIAAGATSVVALFYVLGALGAALVGIVTGIALIGLTRHPSPEELPARPQ